MCAGEEGIWTDPLRVRVFHGVPASHRAERPEQALLEARFAGQVALAPVLINKAALLQVAMVGIGSTEHELDVQVMVTLPTYDTFLTNGGIAAPFHVLAGAARVARYLLDSLEALDLGEAAGPQGGPHGRIPDRHAEVALAGLWNKVLVQRFRLWRSRTRISINQA